jgi:hypothetical protein
LDCASRLTFDGSGGSQVDTITFPAGCTSDNYLKINSDPQKVILEGTIEGTLELDITAATGNSGTDVLLEFPCHAGTCSITYADMTEVSTNLDPAFEGIDKDRLDRKITTRLDPNPIVSEGSLIVSVCQTLYCIDDLS